MYSFLTWLHHMGMGPSEGAKRQADNDAFFFWHFWLLALEERLAYCDTLMSLCYKENIFKDIALILSVFAWGPEIIYSLHLSHYAFVVPVLYMRFLRARSGMSSENKLFKSLPPLKSIEGVCNPVANAQVFASLHLFAHRCVFTTH